MLMIFIISYITQFRLRKFSILFPARDDEKINKFRRLVVYFIEGVGGLGGGLNFIKIIFINLVPPSSVIKCSEN